MFKIIGFGMAPLTVMLGIAVHAWTERDMGPPRPGVGGSLVTQVISPPMADLGGNRGEVATEVSGNISPSSAAPRGLGYSTGFEFEEGFMVGPLAGQQGWNAIGGSGTEAHIDTANPTPATGVQHLRHAFDAAAPNGTGKRSTSPNVSVEGVVTISLDVSISATGVDSYEGEAYDEGGTYDVLLLDPMGNVTAQVQFYPHDTDDLEDDIPGEIRIRDVFDAGPTLISTGTEYTTGAYKELRLISDPSVEKIFYYYAGALIYVEDREEGLTIENLAIEDNNFQDTDPPECSSEDPPPPSECSRSPDFADFDNLNIHAEPIPMETCYTTWDRASLCIDDPDDLTPGQVTICNHSDVDHLYHWKLVGAGPMPPYSIAPNHPVCFENHDPLDDPKPGPDIFMPGEGFELVPANMCKDIDIEIGCQGKPGYEDLGPGHHCYRFIVDNLDTATPCDLETGMGCDCEHEGTIFVTHWSVSVQPWDDDPEIGFACEQEVVFNVELRGSQPGMIHGCQIHAMPSLPNTPNLISLNGLPAGTSFDCSTQIAGQLINPGSENSVPVRVRVRFIAAQRIGSHDVILQLDFLPGGTEPLVDVTSTQVRSGCWAGDLNGNCNVDSGDFDAFLEAFGHCQGSSEYDRDPRADFDHDGCITLVDYQMWLETYHTCDPNR